LKIKINREKGKMIVTKFPKDVLIEAASFNIGDELLDERQPETGITIDDKSSKDLDDAFILETKDDGWILNVSITDVAYAIKKDSGLFNEALNRIFTNYRKKENDPMIPKILSEKKLSLIQNQLRPAITFSMKLSHSLEISDLTIRKTAFKSKRRMCYSEVDLILAKQKTDEQFEHLSQCYSLASMLMTKRRENGALVIYDLIKGIYTNEEGQILAMAENQRHKSNIIVQEFMILTNSAVAQYIVRKNRTILFRNHTARKTTPNHLELQEQYDLALMNEKILETLKQRTVLWFDSAKYSTVLKGHFGLNLSAYSHFTSPIRRLPDLINQYIIHSILDGRRNPFSKEKLKNYSLIINNKYTLLKKEKNLHFKEQSIQVLSEKARNIKYEDHETLDLKSFKNLVQRTCKDNVMADEFSRVILAKLNDGQLGAEHLVPILFELKNDTEEKRKLKDDILEYIKEHKDLASRILNTAQQLNYIDNIKNDVIRIENGFAVRIILCKRIENLSSSRYNIENNKKDAIHSASYEFLYCYVHHNFVNADDVTLPEIIKGKEISEENIDDNYVGNLNVLCTTKPKLNLAEYEFTKTGQSHEPTFECRCRVKTTIRTEETSGKGSNKKIAKQVSAKKMRNLLTEFLKNEIDEALPPDEVQIIEEVIITENYVGFLEEILKKNKNISELTYSYIAKPSIHNPIFICKCNANYEGKKLETSAESSKKKNAKQNAAKEMYEYLNKINALSISEIHNEEPVSFKTEVEVNINYTGKLLELYSRHNNWTAPQYEFKINGPVHSPMISCNCILFINKNKFETISESNKKKTAKHLSSLEMLKKLLNEVSIPHKVEEEGIKNLDSLYLMNLKEKCYEKGFKQPELKVYKWKDANIETCTCYCNVDCGKNNIEVIGIGNNTIEAASDAEEQIISVL
jgi:ribonuclease R